MLLLLLALLSALVVWRLGSESVSIDFARPYVEDALSQNDLGVDVRLGGLSLSWPEITRPLVLVLDDVDLSHEGADVLAIEQVEMGISGLSVMKGRLRPLSIRLDNLRLQLIRTVDGAIELGFSLPQNLDVDDKAQAAPDLDDFIRRNLLSEEDGGSPVFGRLNSFMIENARLNIEDRLMDSDWYFDDIDIGFSRIPEGLSIQSSLTFPHQRGSGEDTHSYGSLDIRADYHLENADLGVAVSFANFDPRAITDRLPGMMAYDDQVVFINGTSFVRFDHELTFLSAEFDIHADGASLNLPDLYEDTKIIEHVDLKGAYDRKAANLRLESLTAKMGESTLVLEGNIPFTEDLEDISLSLQAPLLLPGDLDRYWPDRFRDLPASRWLTQRISGGQYENFQADIVLRGALASAEPDISIEDIKAETLLLGMNVNYNAPLPPLEGADATARYTYGEDRLDIDIAKGKIGNMSLTTGTVSIVNLAADIVGTATVNARFDTDLPSVFSYIAHEPIGVGEAQTGFAPEAVRGDAELDVTIVFPTSRDLKKEDVRVTAKGTLRDVFLPDVVRTLDLSGGPLSLKVEGGRIELEGQAALAERPVTLSYRQYLDAEGQSYEAQAEARITADKALRDALGIDIEDWAGGSFPVEILFTDFGRRSQIEVTADLQPGIARLEQFDYVKPRGQEGTARMVIYLENEQLQEIADLNVTTPELSLTGGRLIFGQGPNGAAFRRGRFESLTYGETEISFDLEQTSPQSMTIDVKGPFLDARTFLRDDPPSRASEQAGGDLPMAITASVNVTRMRTHDARLVEGVSLYFEQAPNSLLRRLEFDAEAGGGQMYFRLRPNDAGLQTLQFEAENAGAALRAFDIYDNIRGGRMVVIAEAESRDNPFFLKGQAELTEFRVINAPVLARLVSAISPTGLPQLLRGEGLYFARLTSGFEWLMRPEGDLFAFIEGRTSGTSLGLTFEGQLDQARAVINISGHVVPVSEINNLIGNIPLLGDIIAGGRGDALFAATYSVAGETENPDVTVNPLSVLAPGILRKIFFE